MVCFLAESQELAGSSCVVYCGSPGTHLEFWCGLLLKTMNPSSVLEWFAMESQEAA
jgi:hypothetical protein